MVSKNFFTKTPKTYGELFKEILKLDSFTWGMLLMFGLITATGTLIFIIGLLGFLVGTSEWLILAIIGFAMLVVVLKSFSGM